MEFKKDKPLITINQQFQHNRDLLEQLKQPSLRPQQDLLKEPSLRPQRGLVRQLTKRGLSLRPRLTFKKTQKKKLNHTILRNLRDEKEMKQLKKIIDKQIKNTMFDEERQKQIRTRRKLLTNKFQQNLKSLKPYKEDIEYSLIENDEREKFELPNFDYDEKPTVIIVINLHSSIPLYANTKRSNEELFWPKIEEVPSEKELYISNASNSGFTCLGTKFDELNYITTIGKCKQIQLLNEKKNIKMSFNNKLYILYKTLYDEHYKVYVERNMELFKHQKFSPLSKLTRMDSYFEKIYETSRIDRREEKIEQYFVTPYIKLNLYDIENVETSLLKEIKDFLSYLTTQRSFERSYLINMLFSFGIERIILFDMGCNGFEETNKTIVRTEEQKQTNYENIKQFASERNIKGGKYKKIKKNKFLLV